MVMFPSGQRGQTQDLMRHASRVRIPSLPPVRLAQLAERMTLNHVVVGSRPTLDTTDGLHKDLDNVVIH